MRFKKQVLCMAASLMTALAAGCILGDGTEKTRTVYAPVKGMAGTPRFNLQFTNGQDNDVDLYVKTPNGSVISYSNPAAQNGKMDIDCLCSDCNNGANENIYWVAGTAPKGTYAVWVNYFDPCLGTNGSANYIIRIMNGATVIKAYTGSVSTKKRNSPVYTFVY